MLNKFIATIVAYFLGLLSQESPTEAKAERQAKFHTFCLEQKAKRQATLRENFGEQFWKATGTTGYYVWNPNLSYARDGQPFFPFGQPAPQGWGTVQC